MEIPCVLYGCLKLKKKMSELLQRAAEGERIGITRRGKLAAVLGQGCPLYELG
jgi:hypothetical protein